MFDNIICKYPLPAVESLKDKAIDWSKEDFQTKDLENYLYLYEITSEGMLIEKVIEYDYVEAPKEDLKQTPDELNPLTWRTHIPVEKASYDEIINHHGTVNFYTSAAFSDEEEVWVTFRAYFSYGKVDKIDLIEEYKITSYKQVNLELAQAKEKAEKKLWNRFKKAVRPYGWTYSWNKIIKMLEFAQKVLTKVTYAIYRNVR